MSFPSQLSNLNAEYTLILCGSTNSPYELRYVTDFSLKDTR